MRITKKELEFYSKQGTRTEVSPGTFDNFPDDLEGIVKIMQGFLIHLGRARKLKFPKQRLGKVSLRTVQEVIGEVMKMNSNSLIKKRKIQERVVVTCKHFSSILASILRSKGISSRARCGFATYFNPGWFEDHWICEYWHRKEKRWVQVDAQMDEFWKKRLCLDSLKINTLDLKNGQFFYGSELWQLFREDKVSGDICGFSLIPNFYGPWYIRGNMVRDFFSLNGTELIYLEESKLMSRDYKINKRDLIVLDKVAQLTSKVSNNFNELRKFYEKRKDLRPKEIK